MDDAILILRNYEKYLWQLILNSDSITASHIIYAIGSVDNYITNHIKSEEDRALTEKYKGFHQYEDKRI